MKCIIFPEFYRHFKYSNFSENFLTSCVSFHLGFSYQTLVVHGNKNSGKSSLLSRASSLSFDWFSSNCCIVYRCIGETPDSSVLTLLLRSICLQISHAYGRPLNIIPSVCFLYYFSSFINQSIKSKGASLHRL